VCHAMTGANMASFAALYTDANTDKDDLQIGLYVQALLYHKSSQRRVWLPSMRNPVAIAQMGAARARQHFYSRCGCSRCLKVGRTWSQVFLPVEPLLFGYRRHIAGYSSRSWTGSDSGGRSEVLSHVVSLLPRSRTG
jgi:hypothetical protein